MLPGCLALRSCIEALKFLNDEYLEIRDRYPGEFALMANAQALEEGRRPIVEEMISQGGAKAIAVASSYGDGSERAFLDSPKAEWLWEFAAANGIVVHIQLAAAQAKNEEAGTTLKRFSTLAGKGWSS
jgi:hypothetical protein